MAADGTVQPADTVRAVERAALDFLASALLHSDFWQVGVAAGLGAQTVPSAHCRRIFAALEKYYATSVEPPLDARLLELHGALSSDVALLDETAGALSVEHVEQIARGLIEASAERDRRELSLRAKLAIDDGNTEYAVQLLGQATTKGKVAKVDRLSTSEIFAPLEPTEWISPGLQLCAGRPMQIVGYGGSAKTISVQSLALAFAASKPIWGLFAPGEPGRVLHLDWEQGAPATRLRYQRLALGMGIDTNELAGRIELVCHPGIWLNERAAEEWLLRECAGCRLVIVDSLKAATRGIEENDSEMREALDMLTRVSLRHQCAFCFLHHSSKGEPSDAREAGRGSGAISSTRVD